MKKFFLIPLAAIAMIFLVSCGDSKKTENEEQNDTDEIGSDTDETAPDNDSGKTETADDNGKTDSGDSQPDDSADTADDADKTDTVPDESDSAGDTDGDTDVPQTDTDTETNDNEPDPDSEFTANENLNPVPPEQKNNTGDECDFDTFVEFCDGNDVVYCKESVVKRSSCGTMTCITTVGLYDNYGDKNYAECYSKCNKAGETSTTCRGKTYFSEDNSKSLVMGTLIHDMCLKTSKGNFLFDDTNRTTEEQCDSPCKNSTSCRGLAEIPPEQKNNTNAVCDETFQEFCEGNTAVFCYSGRVTRSNCGSNTCITTFDLQDKNAMNNVAGCHPSCDDSGSSSKTCTTVVKENETVYATTYDFCIPTSKGSLEFSYFGEKCTRGCAADGKSCK